MSVYIFRPLKSDGRVSADPVWRENRMKVLHEAMKVLVEPLQEGELNCCKNQRAGSIKV